MDQYAFKNDFVEIFLQNGILFVVFGQHAHITASQAKIIVEERLKVCNGLSYPTLADCRRGSHIDKISREIFASPEAVQNVTAGALLIENPIQRMIINSYLFFNTPKTPNMVFTNKEKALEWLRLFVMHQN